MSGNRVVPCWEVVMVVVEACSLSSGRTVFSVATEGRRHASLWVPVSFPVPFPFPLTPGWESVVRGVGVIEGFGSD